MHLNSLCYLLSLSSADYCICATVHIDADILRGMGVVVPIETGSLGAVHHPQNQPNSNFDKFLILCELVNARYKMHTMGIVKIIHVVCSLFVLFLSVVNTGYTTVQPL